MIYYKIFKLNHIYFYNESHNISSLWHYFYKYNNKNSKFHIVDSVFVPKVKDNVIYTENFKSFNEVIETYMDYLIKDMKDISERE